MWDSGVNTKGLELANDLSSTYKNDTCKKLLDNDLDPIFTSEGILVDSEENTSHTQ